MHLSLFCMLWWLIKAKKKWKETVLHKIPGSIFYLLGYFYAFGGERNLNMTLPSHRQMTAIIHGASQGAVARILIPGTQDSALLREVCVAWFGKAAKE